MATEKLLGRHAARSRRQYGSAGLASYAISAVDNALWDLKGKLLGRPVYELLGGPQKESIPCYASNTDLSYGVEHSDRLVPGARLQGGQALPAPRAGGRHRGDPQERGAGRAAPASRSAPDVELMVDAWMSLNVEYIVRLMDALRPYRVKWLEDYLLPEDTGQLRQGAPAPAGRDPGHRRALVHDPPVRPGGQPGPGGHPPAGRLLGRRHHAPSVRICHLAEAHGLTVIGHAGMNYPYGQHLALAMPSIPMGERSEGVAPPGRAAGGDDRPAGHGARSRTAASARPTRPASGWRSRRSGWRATPPEPHRHVVGASLQLHKTGEPHP